MAAPGMVVGALLAAGAGLAMRSMLLGMRPLDPFSFLSAGGLLLGPPSYGMFARFVALPPKNESSWNSTQPPDPSTSTR